MPLTDTKVKNAKPSEKVVKLTDGFGLYLLVHPNGSKYWQLGYRFERETEGVFHWRLPGCFTGGCQTTPG